VLYALAADPEASAMMRDEAVSATLAALGAHLETKDVAVHCVHAIARLCTQYKASSPIVRSDCVRRVASANGLTNIVDAICPRVFEAGKVSALGGRGMAEVLNLIQGIVLISPELHDSSLHSCVPCLPPAVL
jgi:protein-disulfide isomerase-like protein with CxxC motif